MATQYEILLQQQLERSRSNPVDEYSAGLLDLARFQAQQRFIREETAARLAGQKEILTQTQVAEAEEWKKRFAQQKELQTTLLASQAQIQKDRDIAEGLRAEARDIAAETRLDKKEAAAAARQVELLSKQAEALEKKNEAAEKKNREYIEGRLKEAKIEAEAQVTAAEARAKVAERSKLMDKFGGKGIVRKKGETDEDYVARAQEEYKGALAGQLANTHGMIQDTGARIAALTRAAIQSYPNRLSDAAWRAARGLVPEPQRKQLEQMTPAKREEALNHPKLKAAKTQYDISYNNARETIRDFDPETEVQVLNLNRYLQQLQDDQSRKLVDPEYAPAIPEFHRLIAPPGTPPPGAGLAPPPAGAGGGLDFSKAALAPVAPGAGTGAGASAPRPLAPGAPVAGITSYDDAVRAGITMPAAAGAAVDPGVAARIAAREAAPLPPTPDEIYGGAPYGWLPGQRTPLIGRFGEPVEAAGAAFRNFSPSLLATVPIDFGIASANQWLGTPSFSLTEAAKRIGFAQPPPPENPQLLQAELRSMGLPPNLNPPERGLPPTPAEIATFRAGVPPRVMAGPRSYDEAVRPTPSPPMPPVARPPELFPPTNLESLLRDTSTEARLLEDYRRRTAPVFDPTAVRGTADAAARANAPGLRAATPAEVALSESALATELRKRIAKHPKARMYPVSPLKDKLSTMGLRELKAFYHQLGPEEQAPAEIGR